MLQKKKKNNYLILSYSWSAKDSQFITYSVLIGDTDIHFAQYFKDRTSCTR